MAFIKKAPKTLGLKTSSKSFARARRTLGQNFLKSPTIASGLVKAAQVGSSDTVLEVGPGRGMVTRELLKKVKKIIAVEKDKYLIEYLKKKFNREIVEGKLQLVYGDILKFNPTHYSLLTTHYKIVASIPYYITSRFLRIFLGHECCPQTIALIIQKEVARRIIAKDKKESLLSLSVKAYGTPRYIKTIKAREFSPQPKVDSAMLIIQDISRKFFDKIDEEEFFKLLRTGFSHKRKLLIKNVKPLHEAKSLETIFKVCGIPSNARAEDLSLQEWKKLFLELYIR